MIVFAIKLFIAILILGLIIGEIFWNRCFTEKHPIPGNPGWEPTAKEIEDFSKYQNNKFKSNRDEK